MCQNDAHLFVRPDQIKEEFSKVVALILDVYADFHINDYKFRLSLRDREDVEKYYPDDEMWDKAENELRTVLTELDIPFYEAIGEAAFYGPKLDVQIKTAIGHDITLSTCQLDFLLPERFDLNYIDETGEKKRPVVIHRAILGTFDRFMAYLIEETKGAFPLWLAPIQINVIPVNLEYHEKYSNEIFNWLRENDYRVDIDLRNEKLSYKMRESVIRKIPITLILGQKEMDEVMISYRLYGTNETTTLSKKEFLLFLQDKMNQKN